MRRALATLASLLLVGMALTPPGLHAQRGRNPDDLYNDRANAGRAREAIDLWTARLEANPGDLVSGWKLARACYWMGTAEPGSPDEQKKWLLDGLAAAQRVSDLAPERPEGHFWRAANMSALAETGTREGIRYRRSIRDALERVLAINPAYLDGSADRGLGQWYFKVPGLLGGNKTRAEEHLRKALDYKPDSISSLLYLAQVLIDRNRRAEAKTYLEAALAAPIDPAWAPEDRRFKEEARVLLKQVVARLQ